MESGAILPILIILAISVALNISFLIDSGKKNKKIQELMDENKDLRVRLIEK